MQPKGVQQQEDAFHLFSMFDISPDFAADELNILLETTSASFIGARGNNPPGSKGTSLEFQADFFFGVTNDSKVPKVTLSLVTLAGGGEKIGTAVIEVKEPGLHCVDILAAEDSENPPVLCKALVACNRMALKTEVQEKKKKKKKFFMSKAKKIKFKKEKSDSEFIKGFVEDLIFFGKNAHEEKGKGIEKDRDMLLKCNASNFNSAGPTGRGSFPLRDSSSASSGNHVRAVNGNSARRSYSIGSFGSSYDSDAASMLGKDSTDSASASMRSSQTHNWATKLFTMLPLLKELSNRATFVNMLVLNAPKAIAEEVYENLKDTVLVCLRLANNLSDYDTCETLYNVSRLYWVNNEFGEIRFLFTDIKKHEAFRNDMFWHAFIHEMTSSLDSNADSTDAFFDMLKVVVNLQITSGMSQRVMTAFLDQICEEYNSDEATRKEMLSYMLDHCRLLEHSKGERRDNNLDWSSIHFSSSPTTGRKPKMLRGETEIKSLDRVFHCGLQIPGDLLLTNYRLIFISLEQELNNEDFADYFQIPVGSVFRLLHTDSKNLSVSCKDYRDFGFVFDLSGPAQKERQESFELFCQELKVLAFPGDVTSTFAFSYKMVVVGSCNGWHLYDAEREIRRMVKDLDEPDSKWRITRINEDFKFSSTYPPVLAVPAGTSDTDLKKVKGFRSKGRIPALVYAHTNGAVILRCAQPLVGLAATRSREDEDLLLKAGVGVIIDARPKKNAIANKAKGGGYENEGNYPKATIQFMDIDNIHVMRESMNKVCWLCARMISQPDDDDYHASLLSTGWLKNVRYVLLAANKIKDYLVDGVGIIVHCSDGWDRTPQLTALAQLLLDPYYRTRNGFACLVEKEWLSYGHKFQERVGHASKEYNDSERSPIFMQFLDCVYQIMLQFPCSFEFNTYFIEYLGLNLFSNLYGTFFYNTEKDRVESRVRTKTPSIWSYLLKGNRTVNVLYKRRDEPLNLCCDYRLLDLWPFYYRFDSSFRTKDDAYECAMDLVDHETKQAEDLTKELETELKKLEKEVKS